MPKLNFGSKAKHPSWEDREKDRSRVSIDWDAIAQERAQRIKWEIEQGLNPIEAFEVTEAPKPPPRPSNNPFGGPKKYDHDEMVRLYVEEGLTGEQIALKLGANRATVYGVLKQRNVTREYNGGNNQYTHAEP